MTRLLIVGKNHEIPATAFQQIGRGLASQGGSGCRRTSQAKDTTNRVPIVAPSSGGSGLSNTAAADLVFWFLCAMIFAGTPLVVVMK